MTFDEKLAGIIPHERQVHFQQLEFYAFIHFTVNTFTDKEWGDGTESPDIFDPRRLDARDSDLGSRKILTGEEELIWYPAEVNTSIRPGRFWHESENDKVRSLDELIHIYNNSVGGNATFLLNIPPTNEGLLHENDVKRLAELGEYLQNTFAENILDDALFSADGSNIEAVRRDDYDEYYTAGKGCTTAVITAKWNFPVSVGSIVLKENILCGQRVEKFTVEVLQFGEYVEVYSGTVIGYKRIVPLKNIRTASVRIRINDSRTEPTLAFVGIYKGE